VFGIFYFLLIRPQNQQRKQHEAMLKELKKGDKITANLSYTKDEGKRDDGMMKMK
jgi:preprotein translocase subunit YajC